MKLLRMSLAGLSAAGVFLLASMVARSGWGFSPMEASHWNAVAMTLGDVVDGREVPTATLFGFVALLMGCPLLALGACRLVWMKSAPLSAWADERKEKKPSPPVKRRVPDWLKFVFFVPISVLRLFWLILFGPFQLLGFILPSARIRVDFGQESDDEEESRRPQASNSPHLSGHPLSGQTEKEAGEEVVSAEPPLLTLGSPPPSSSVVPVTSETPRNTGSALLEALHAATSRASDEDDDDDSGFVSVDQQERENTPQNTSPWETREQSLIASIATYFSSNDWVVRSDIMIDGRRTSGSGFSPRIEGTPPFRVPLVALSSTDIVLVVAADLQNKSWTMSVDDPIWRNEDGDTRDCMVRVAARLREHFLAHHAEILQAESYSPLSIRTVVVLDGMEKTELSDDLLDDWEALYHVEIIAFLPDAIDEIAADGDQRVPLELVEKLATETSLLLRAA